MTNASRCDERRPNACLKSACRGSLTAPSTKQLGVFIRPIRGGGEDVGFIYLRFKGTRLGRSLFFKNADSCLRNDQMESPHHEGKRHVKMGG
jgi:hypothetical protein